MAQRIKITAFLDVADVDPEHLDLNHESGLSEEGYMQLLTIDGGQPLKLSDLTDVDTRLVG